MQRKSDGFNKWLRFFQLLCFASICLTLSVIGSSCSQERKAKTSQTQTMEEGQSLGEKRTLGQSKARTADVLYRVSRIIDGDTIEIETGEKIRYIGVNTPETKHPTKGVEYYMAKRHGNLIESLWRVGR